MLHTRGTVTAKAPTVESSLASDSDPSDSGSSTTDDAYYPRIPLKLGTTEAYLMSSPFFSRY